MKKLFFAVSTVLLLGVGCVQITVNPAVSPAPTLPAESASATTTLSPTKQTAPAVATSPPKPSIIDCKQNYDCLVKQLQNCLSTKGSLVTYANPQEVGGQQGLRDRFTMRYQVTAEQSGKCQLTYTQLKDIDPTPEYLQALQKDTDAEGYQAALKLINSSTLTEKYTCQGAVAKNVLAFFVQWKSGAIHTTFFPPCSENTNGTFTCKFSSGLMCTQQRIE